jgi:hypothetical protein
MGQNEETELRNKPLCPRTNSLLRSPRAMWLSARGPRPASPPTQPTNCKYLLASTSASRLKGNHAPRRCSPRSLSPWACLARFSLKHHDALECGCGPFYREAVAEDPAYFVCVWLAAPAPLGLCRPKLAVFCHCRGGCLLQYRRGHCRRSIRQAPAPCLAWCLA